MDAAHQSHRRKLAVIGAFAAFLGIGLLGSLTKSTLLPALGGVEPEPQPATWTWAGWNKQPAKDHLAPQTALEQAFDRRAGWRNFLVRLDNQVSWSLFGETHELPVVNGETVGTRVIYGVNEWLLEEHYVRHAVTPGTTPEPELRDRIARIKRVQDKLAARGVPLLLVVAPSKAELYPEKVPPHLWQGRDRTQVTTNFERARPLFNEAGVHWIDGPALYARWKADGKRNLFARSGVHWSYRSAVDVIAEIRRELNATMRRPMPELLVVGEQVAAPKLNDRDLLDLANLLVPWPYEHSVPFPQIEPQRTVAETELPRILWVHDSFGWPLIDPIYWGGVAAPSDSFYYFKTPKRIPGGHNLPYEMKDVNWPEYLARKDAVVVVWTEIAQDFWGWGFFDAVDAALP